MVDVSDATFEIQILERSDQVPVVVDLWAPWCGPCQTLGPILERVIDETEGAVALAKVNTDENPRLSEMFQVQGIPAVFAVVKRAVVSTFQGAQPESVVRQFVQALLPTAEEQQLAELLATGDEASLLQALELAPGHPEATVALAECYVESGRPDEALAVLAKVPETPESRRVAALARTGAAPDWSTLDELLPRVKDDDEARQQFLDVLELMGPEDPRTADYRRALSRQLF